jgi:endonuclease YncB( thermonuclease family)
VNGTRATLSVFALCLPLTSAAESLTGKLVGATHGDTITVLVADRPIKVRLAEFSSPALVEAHARNATYAAFPNTGSSSGAGSETRA